MRLRRTGRTKRPQYRIVIAESASPRDGKFVEIVGFYNPLTDPATVAVKEERVKHWLSVGVRPTETVHRLLARKGVMEAYQAPPQSKKALAKRQQAAAAAQATAE